jgi:hypothetical protein
MGKHGAAMHHLHEQPGSGARRVVFGVACPGHQHASTLTSGTICGSGRFVISAAKLDPRMTAIATVRMYDMGGAHRNGLKRSGTVEQHTRRAHAALTPAIGSELQVL